MPAGAWFTCEIECVRATLAVETCVVPPVAPVSDTTAPVVIVCPLSIRFALSAVAASSYSFVGRKRSRSVAFNVMAAAVVAFVRLVQLVPALVVYCQFPFDVLTV